MPKQSFFLMRLYGYLGIHAALQEHVRVDRV